MAYNRSGGGMGPWAFILGAIVILVIGIIWYLGAGSPAVDAPADGDAEIIAPDADAPDVDINNEVVEPDGVEPDVDVDIDPEPLPEPGTGNATDTDAGTGTGTTVPEPAPAD